MEKVTIELETADAIALANLLEQVPLSGQAQALRPVLALIHRIRAQVAQQVEKNANTEAS